jgi:hypothetical protein
MDVLSHTLSIGCLSGGDLQRLGGHTDGSLNVKVLLLSTIDQITRNYKQEGSNAG